MVEKTELNALNQIRRGFAFLKRFAHEIGANLKLYPGNLNKMKFGLLKKGTYVIPLTKSMLTGAGGVNLLLPYVGRLTFKYIGGKVEISNSEGVIDYSATDKVNDNGVSYFDGLCNNCSN